MRSAYLLAGLVFAASPLLAQTVAARAAVPVVLQTVLAPITRDVVLPEGTDFTVVTVDERSSKTANKDDVAAMRTDEPVVVGSQVVRELAARPTSVGEMYGDQQ